MIRQSFANTAKRPVSSSARIRRLILPPILRVIPRLIFRIILARSSAFACCPDSPPAYCGAIHARMKAVLRRTTVALMLIVGVRSVAHAEDSIRLSPGQLWARGFAAGSRIAMTADIDADGRADIISLNPRGNGGLEASLTSPNGKARFPKHLCEGFGKDAVTAVCGDFTGAGRMETVAVSAAGEVSIAHGFRPEEGRYEKQSLLGVLPQALRPVAPAQAAAGDLLGSGRTDVLIVDAAGALLLLRNMPVPPGKLRLESFRVNGGPIQARRIAVAANGSGRSALVWIDQAGRVNRAYLVSSGTRGYQFERPVVIAQASPEDGLAAGRFTGGPASDILIGHRLLIKGDPRHACLQPDLPPVSETRDDARWLAADIDGDGLDDLVRLRRSDTPVVGDDVLVHFSQRHIGPGWNASTAQDGLLDRWKTGEVKPGGLDLMAFGCKVHQRDVIVEVQRMADVSEAEVRRQIDRAVVYFARLPVTNSDGSRGISLHVIYREAIPTAYKDMPWAELAEKYHPRNHRGVTHWLLVYNGGGGQSSEMADRGSCGVQALYATFLHEFGHQLGLDHTGRWGPNWCPTYPSLMNYAYNYQLNGSIDQIGYSDGRLASVVLDERHLSETLPLPMHRVAFLAGPPYYYRMRPSANGKSTLIDWNWNGVFGERDVAADINYGYSTQAGERHIVAKCRTAPVLTAIGAGASDSDAGLLLVYGDLPGGASPAGMSLSTPSLSPKQPGRLLLRRWRGADPEREGGSWSDESVVEAEGVVGDASAAQVDGSVWIAYPYQSADGRRSIALRCISVNRSGGLRIGPRKIAQVRSGEPTLACLRSGLALVVWIDRDSPVECVTLEVEGESLRPIRRQSLGLTSNAPVGAAGDGSRTLWIGITRDVPGGLTSRPQIGRFTEAVDGTLAPTALEWVGGEQGKERFSGRLVLLREPDSALGSDGQIYLFGCGLMDPNTSSSCHYVSSRVANRPLNGGWLTKRYYDEWTQSRSAPAACFFGKDIAFASRWMGDAPAFKNDDLFVGFFGRGIESRPMGDFDDIGFIRDIGLSHSIVYCGE